METLAIQIAQKLNDTLNPDKIIVSSATETLDHLSSLPAFPLALIAITTGGDSQGQRIAAASYLKNFISRHEGDPTFPKICFEFRNQLVHAVLRVESTVVKVLVEALRLVVVADFVKEDLWPELVPELRSAIQSSNLISGGGNSQWKTINALMIIQTIIKPFQYFLNPQNAREPVPPQLELIATEFLVPLHAIFHQFLEKALLSKGRTDVETERIILILCKCFYFAVRSHMPSALSSVLPYLCRDLFGLLDSLNFNGVVEDQCLLRMKSGKRSLLMFCALVTRHRKHADKLMPNIMTAVLKIVKQTPSVGRLDFLSERVVSLAFDVISHVLETGPGWRLVSPHFSSLLESSVFPALVMNQKDITEWEEDADEYIRKNLPSDLDEISGFKEDSFTARKSAINLLGVLSMSKGPPMVGSASNKSSAASTKRKKGDKNNKGKQNRSSIGELLVMPFLSKFPVPSDGTCSKISHDYYGVLMAYGGLQDFLKERNPEYTATLVRNRILPVYLLSPCLPYLVASANWVLGELASCLPQEMSAEIYYSLMKTLAMPDVGDISCYPVRASAAGAVSELLENDYQPSEWLALLQVLVNGTNNEDETEASLFFQLLSTAIEIGQEKVAVHIPAIVSTIAVAISKHIPPIPEPWPQVVEKGFASLAVMAQIWDDSMPDDDEDNQPNQELRLGSATIATTFAQLLQQAWFSSMPPTAGATSGILPPPSCLDDASALIGAIMRYTTETDAILGLKLPDLLVTWADLIADWHAWQEMEDMSVFDAIQEAVYLHRKCELKNFLVRRVPSPPYPPVPQRSIIESIGVFVSEAIAAYPSATWRACLCAHSLLHAPRFSFETEDVKQALAIAFTEAAFSHFKLIRSKPAALWKPLLLVISSCYLCYPDYVERVLEKAKDNGFTMWVHGLSHISTSSFEPGLSSESEIKLAVMTLTKVVERLLGSASDLTVVARDCFLSLLEAAVHLKKVQEEEEDEEDGTEDDDEDGDVETDDEDSDEDEREETEEEFLERYAQAAVALENGMVAEEGDVDDQVQDLELGDLDEIDEQSAVISLIAKHQQVLVKGQELPPQLITGFVNTFPQCASFFQT